MCWFVRYWLRRRGWWSGADHLDSGHQGWGRKCGTGSHGSRARRYRYPHFTFIWNMNIAFTNITLKHREYYMKQKVYVAMVSTHTMVRLILLFIQNVSLKTRIMSCLLRSVSSKITEFTNLYQFMSSYNSMSECHCHSLICVCMNLNNSFGV